jgi:hypothetical protein
MTTHKLATFQCSREFHHQGTLKDSISDVTCGQSCTVVAMQAAELQEEVQ